MLIQKSRLMRPSGRNPRRRSCRDHAWPSAASLVRRSLRVRGRSSRLVWIVFSMDQKISQIERIGRKEAKDEKIKCIALKCSVDALTNHAHD